MTNVVEKLQEMNDSSANNSNTTLKSDFEFNHRLLLNVIAYSIMFIVGTIGNTIVFVAARRQNRSTENVGRTNVHMMVLHLTIADLVILNSLFQPSGLFSHQSFSRVSSFP